MKSRVSSAVVITGATLLSLGAVLAACSGDQGGDAAPQPVAPAVPPPPEAGAPAPVADAAPPKVIPKPTFPEVQSRGGPVVKAPRVVAILFAGDPLATQITDFTSKIATSAYWKGVAQEYGVGPMTPLDTITVDEAAPATISSSQIETWLAAKLSGATPAFGAPDASTLYAIYYPASTTIKEDGAGALGQSCQGYGGYHFEIDAGGTKVGYAVLPRCSDIDELTVAASHEYFEWATDPFPKTKPAFNKLDDAHWAWQAAMIGELGDLCTFLDRDNLHPPEIDFEVQRQWSNKQSLAGKYPCAPAMTTRPYFQGITIAEDDAIVPSYDPLAKNIMTKAVRVKPGESRSVDVLVYSDQPSSELVPLRAQTYSQFYGGSPAGGEKTGYAFSLDQSYGKVGETVSVTITAPKEPAYDLLMMLAYTSQRSVLYWPVLVVNDDAADVAAGKATITPERMPKRPNGAFARPLGRTVPPFTTLGMRRPDRTPR